jgi:ribonuclease HII
MKRPHHRIESRLIAKGAGPVAGIDEAGRGPLAGPVAAAAVILDRGKLPRGVNDSKALDAEAREEIYEDIMSRALAVSVAFGAVAEIDAINIRQATFAAMRRACAGLSLRPGYLLIDGCDFPDRLGCPGEAIVKGDAKCISIAAASIVAKVTRDRLMRRLANHHPVYGFERHSGYATEFHVAAIAKNGPSPFHRMSFSPFRLLPSESV